MRIVLVGARGQLAISLRGALAAHDVVTLSRRELDISDASRVVETVRTLRPDVVINAAAIRRPDECERRPEHAFAVNALGAKHVALACASTGSALVHYSTDNVFDGRKMSPYTEEDVPSPITMYGVTKLAGEFFVRHLLEKAFIVRTSGLFGGTSEGGTNFVLTMLRKAREGERIRVVTDQQISPTYTEDLARKTAWLISGQRYGLYHITNAGECSWFQFARAIFERTDLDVDVVPTTTDQMRFAAPRLRYAVLANRALERLGASDMPSWEDALDRYLHATGYGSRVPV